MAIGDPWDTSYNPKIQDLRNKITGFPPWEPDNSDNVPQTDPLILKDRRGGRFCTEGCGCVDTGASNLAGSKCVLPPELAVTIMRTPDGRYEARSAISGGEGETYHLKFAGGVWRGSKCCSHNSHGELLYACDPCKVTTLPNGKPSECHYANNKYKTITSDNQKDDGFPNRGPWDYDSAIGKGNSSDVVWPRRGADSWMKPSVYDQVLPNEDVSMYTDDTVQKVVTHQSEFSANHLNARINIKAKEKTILVAPDGYLANYTVDNGSSPDPKISDIEIHYPDDGASLIGCLEDGSVPIQKRPWCRDVISGQRIQQSCYDPSLEGKCLDENDQDLGDADKSSCDKKRAEGADVRWEEDPDGKPLYGDKASCSAAGEQWLYDDKEECVFSGVCQSPDGEILREGCFKGDGTPVGQYRNQKSCEQALLDWRYSLPATCTKYYGHELSKCKSTTGEDTEDADQQECEENGHIWYENKFASNEWVDWEYERRSCCGNVILNEAHPFHTPQISGGAAETRKNTTCFTPYSEVILTPNMITGTTAPMAGHGGGSQMSIGNQADRDHFFYDQSDYWTLTIRPCNFWGSCFEEGQTRKDPADMGECRDKSNKIITKGKYSDGYGRCEETSNEKTTGLSLYDTEQKCADYEQTVLGEKGRKSSDEGDVISWNKEGNRTDNEERCTENEGKWVERPDNYYETTCGEEVVLFLPIDQFMNCSDFNLTLSEWSLCEKNDGEIISSTTHGRRADTTGLQELCKEDEGTWITKNSHRSGWSEPYAGWNPLMGNLMGNPAGSETGGGGFPLTAATYGGRGFPGDAIEGIQYSNWCAFPDADWDGQADGHFGDSYINHRACSSHVYWNANGGSHYNELLNAKGADAFYGFNIQPQPFKATEEKQSRAKSMKQAASDKEHWQMCADHKLRWNGGGHWFWDYGPDYFFYFDFVKWDEIGLTGKAGTARASYIKGGGVCETVSNKAQLWIDNHAGQLGRGHCPESPPLYVGWIEQSSLEKACPLCEETKIETSCGKIGSCQHPDGTFDKIGEGECLQKGKCYGPTDEVIEGVDKQYGCTVGDPETQEPIKNPWDCAAAGGEWTVGTCDDYEKGEWRSSVFKTCCEWINGCTLDGSPVGIPGEVIIGYGKGEDTCTRNDVLIKRPDQDACEVDGGTWAKGEENSIPITRPAKDKEECEKDKVYEEPFDGGAEAIWYEQCITSQAMLDSLSDCPPIGRIPDGLLDIVLGDQIGTCVLHKDNGKDDFENASISPMTEEECGKEALKDEYIEWHDPDSKDLISPRFSPDTVGSSDSRYTVRENDIVKLRPAGPATSSLPDVTAIKDGKAPGYYETQYGLLRNQRLPAGNDVGHSMSYWHQTGLWPRGELSSYVNDHCQGLTQHRRIINASNERPIKITARDHLLQDGDMVNIDGVMGNFGANVMTNRDWTETQWEDKIYKECKGDGCDDPMWPNSVCPETTKCLDENGQEVLGKDPLTCSAGECDKKRPSGTACQNETECKAKVGTNTGQDADGKCPYGYTKDDSKGPYEKDGCINDLAGCGGTWTSGAKNVWTTYCDSEKFFACEGVVLKGKEPPPASFFVVQNVTVDTFDLYTCDKHPVDGRIKNPINLDPEAFSGSSKTSLAWYTIYAHMTDISVGVGDMVEKGQEIGKVSNTGGETNHLHFVVAEHRTHKVAGEDYCAGGAVECVSFDARFGIAKCRSSYLTDPRPRSENKYSLAEQQYIQSTLSFPLDGSKNWRRPLFSYLHQKDAYFAEDYYIYPEGSCNLEAALEANLSEGEPVYVASGGGDITSKVKAIVGSEGAVIVEHKVGTNGQIGCPDDTPKVCAANPGIATYERVAESAKYIVSNDDSGLPAIHPFVPRCIDTNDRDVTPAAAEEDCLSPNRWITERNLKDNPETKKTEGEAFCGSYGTCMIVDNEFGVDDSFMTKKDCLLLAETWHTYPAGDVGEKRHVRECIAVDGSKDTSQHATKSQEACEAMHSACLDENDINIGVADKASCDERKEQGQNVRWALATLSIAYNDCVEQTGLFIGNENFDSCWVQAQWMSIANMDASLGSGGGSLGVPNVGVYKVCPFTGDVVFVNNQQDPGIEAGYVGHLGQDTLDDMYRFGYGGPGYKWEDRANDYYVQIEQKGICPVCCDHFMPEKLTATLTGQSSDILNIIGCGFDECANGPLHDGWCCGDGMHSCDMSDLAACEKSPEAFGRCQGEDGRVLSFVGANKRPACEKAGGTFTQMSDLEEFQDGEAKNHCNMFLRKMMVNHTTNCRRCSDVYSSQHKVPLYDGPPGPVDYNGESCCPGCECLHNESDFSTIGCGYEYPTCEEVIACIKGEDVSCDELTEGLVKQVGKVTATCTATPTGTPTPFYRWVMEPCSCFPNHVALFCEPEIIHNPSVEATCDYNGIDCPDGTGDGCYDNRGGCRDTNGDIVDNKSRKEDGATEEDCNKSRCTLTATGETVDVPQHSNCKDKDGKTVSASNEADCVALISAGGACDSNQAPCSWTSGCEGSDYTWIDVPKSATETWFEGSSGCPATHITTDADESCYDVPNSPKPVSETCPGLGTIETSLNYDGVVWRTDWTLMNTVGTHQCDLGQHRFHWPANCQHTGPDDDLEPKFKSADILVAINADCDACDMSQSGMAGRPIDALADGGYPRRHRNVKTPTLPQDGHFIRLVMGCGGSVPSIDMHPGTDGELFDGGFDNADDYRNSGIVLWAEITNCTFVDFTGSEGFKIGRSDTGTSGAPPFYKRGCFSKRAVVGNQINTALEDRSPSPLERKFSFAGRCLNSATSGPKGPCVDTECCTYNNRDVPFAIGGPLWSGAVACSQGGDIKHKCSVFGMDIYPEKPSEQFTVYYVKDVNSKTGEGTLVVRAYPAGWEHCEHAYIESLGSGPGTDSLVGIGVANLADAEQDTLGSYSRNNKSLNPYLPAGGTVITGCKTSLRKSFHNGHKTEYTDHEGIPYGNNLADENGDKGRGNGEFMEVRVANIAPLITKNPRKSRHLRIFDRSGATTLEGMDMLPNLDMAQPYGLNPWPVDHQTHSSPLSKWPKGIVMGPSNTESLRTDPAASLNQPGRVGPLPTMDNLNRMFRYTEEAMGDGTTTPIPEILPVAPVAINEFNNIYSEEDGYCTDSKFKSKDLCTSDGHIWIPQFLYTKATTHMAHDLHDGEKIVISGSVTYPATCKGSRMGYCKGDKTLDINGCNKGECIDTQLGANSPWIKDEQGNTITNKVDCLMASMAKQESVSSGQSDLVFKPKGIWTQVFEDANADKHICETVFGGDWVVGQINNTKDGKGVYEDPDNRYPLKIAEEVKGFLEGCPVGCRFLLNRAM